MFALVICLSTSALAHSPDGEHHPAAHGTPPATVPTVIPETYAGVITALRERTAAASVALAASKLADIHPIAQAISDLAVALPGKATDADKATVTLKALDIKKAAEALHHEADDKNAAGATAALSTASTAVDGLPNQPPR